MHFSSITKPLCSFGSCVVTPVGQVFLLHCMAWIQPSENIKPRADTTQSAPAHKAQATSAGLISLPEAITFMRSRKPYSFSLSTSKGKVSWISNPISSIKVSGAAPVPPSPLSIVMKSGAQSSPRCLIVENNSSSQMPSPITVLKPTGLPVMLRNRFILSSNSSSFLTSRWRFGLLDVWPTGIKRILAISSLTLAAGKIPPFPGLAPWLNFISIILTAGCAATLRKVSSLNWPLLSRTT